ncbi:MAG: Ig-like domain-containing protein, partial [Lachnospiraceae bacterium]|nr:Ig-like domain-containing protein [Lachnospiraceae bacterium]
LSYKIIVEDPQVTTKKELKKGESINISDLIAASTTTFKAKDIAVQKSEIASVDSAGKITALSAGTTKVTFTLGGRTYKIKLKVTE